ncbi:MAG: TrmH family RNA methyltransferase [Pseudomonadota bacterium]
MRGFFSVGVEGMSKPGNAGNLIRTAHSFGASSFFAIAPAVDFGEVRSADTSDAFDHLPFYQYPSPEALDLPKGCQLVGIELVEESIALPSFRHPTRAAYVLGPERGELSPALQERCDFLIQIPMQFCVNVGVAGAIVMYDRMLSMGRFAERPVRAGGPTEPLAKHRHGGQIIRTAGR